MLDKRSDRFSEDEDELSVEEVFGLDGLDDDDDSDQEDDGSLKSDEEAEEYNEDEFDEADRLDDEMMAKISRNIAPQGQFTDDEDEDEEQMSSTLQKGKSQKKKKKNDDDEEDGILAWGNKRASFYVQRGEDLDDETTYKEEEAEVLRLQRKRLEKMTEEDFMDGINGIDAGRFAAGSDEVQPLLSELLEINPETQDVAARRDALSKMGPAALKAMVQTRATDVVKLLKEWDERSSEVQEVLGPALNWFEKGGPLINDERAGAE